MPLNNFSFVEQILEGEGGTLFRSAQPDDHGAFMFGQMLADATVIRLSHSGEGALTPEQERKRCEETGTEFIQDEYPEVLRFGELDHVLKTTALIQDRMLKGRSVLVHCSHGRDRTGLIVGAYLVKYTAWKMEQVTAYNALFGVHGLIAFVDFPDKIILQEIAALSAGPTKVAE